MPNNLTKIIEFKENLNSDFDGTIIDIETFGDFDRTFKNDSRQYHDITQVIFGYLNNRNLHIFCAENIEAIKELKEMINETIRDLKRPYYAFNCEFESCVWFNQLGNEIIFDGELCKYKFEPKALAVKELQISNYDDPFYDNGKLCIKAWHEGDLKKAIAHNRSCLLKERDILLKRGYREPQRITFIK